LIINSLNNPSVPGKSGRKFPVAFICFGTNSVPWRIIVPKKLIQILMTDAKPFGQE